MGKRSVPNQETIYGLNTVAFGNMSLQQLYAIRDLVQNPQLCESSDEFDKDDVNIANTIASLFEHSEYANWAKFYLDCINRLILLKEVPNKKSNADEQIYLEISTSTSGKFKIKQGNNGYIFYLSAPNSEILAVSELYSKYESCVNGIRSVQHNVEAAVEDQTIEAYSSISSPKYEVYLDKSAEYRFRLKARNGEPILASEGYKTKKGCLVTIERVKKIAAVAEIERA